MTDPMNAVVLAFAAALALALAGAIGNWLLLVRGERARADAKEGVQER